MVEQKKEEKVVPKTEDTKGKEENKGFNPSTLIEQINQEIAAEDKKVVDNIKKDMFTKDEVTALIRESMKTTKSNETKIAGTKDELKQQIDTLKSEYEKQLTAIKQDMDKIEKSDVGSKTRTPEETDPWSLNNNNKPVALNEDLGDSKKRDDGYSDATEKYSERNLLKWGVLREVKR